MSFSRNSTSSLWQQFMPIHSSIAGTVDAVLYSIEVYPHTTFFSDFDPTATFEKWAAVEVHQVQQLPEGLGTLHVPMGLYAVFIHRGPVSEGANTYRYILQQWLPNSIYTLDNRPHFARMDEKYRHNHAESEEEIWIPIRP